MKHWKKGVVVGGIGILVALLGVGVWQKDNVQALWEGINYNEDELKDQMQTSKEKIQEALNEYEIKGIRDLTVEEEEKLMKGELSVEEALQLIMNIENESKLENEQGSVSAGSVENTDSSMGDSPSEEALGSAETEIDTETSANPQDGTGKIVQDYVKKMYTLQATFLSELGGIEARARALFASLPEEERNLSTAQKLAPSFINQGLALESSCDSQVNALLKEFEADLKKAGASTAIVDNMKEAYQTQKRLKKASYLAAIK